MNYFTASDFVIITIMQECHENSKTEPHNHNEYLLLYKEGEIPLGRFLDCWKCNIYNTGTHTLPDIYALILRHCAPSGIMRVYIYKGYFRHHKPLLFRLPNSLGAIACPLFYLLHR